MLCIMRAVGWVLGTDWWNSVTVEVWSWYTVRSRDSGVGRLWNWVACKCVAI